MRISQLKEGSMFSDYSMPYNPDALSIVWPLYVVAALVYCAPMIVAFARNVEYKWGLYCANLLFGITGIGWAYCLYYAIFGNKNKAEQNLSIAT
jgi:hypothetical protein